MSTWFLILLASLLLIVGIAGIFEKDMGMVLYGFGGTALQVGVILMQLKGA